MTANFNLKNHIFKNIILSSNIVNLKARDIVVIVFFSIRHSNQLTEI